MNQENNKTIHHDFAYVVFIDPTYEEGWKDRKELPKEKDAIHIGVGVLIKKTDKAYWFAFAEELNDKSSDVMHPQMIHKDCIIKLYTFTEELFDELTKPKTPKRISSKVQRCIDYDVEDFS
jgi:hypothetical protein